MGSSQGFRAHDHRHGGECCTARHAEQAGIGQGIAEQALHGSTSGGKCGADGEGRDHARRADRIEDGRCRIVERPIGQADGRQQLGEADGERTDAQAAHDAEQRGQREQRDRTFQGEVDQAIPPQREALGRCPRLTRAEGSWAAESPSSLTPPSA